MRYHKKIKPRHFSRKVLVFLFNFDTDYVKFRKLKCLSISVSVRKYFVVFLSGLIFCILAINYSPITIQLTFLYLHFLFDFI